MEVARSYERLAEIYYMSNDKPRLLHALLATLNLTENFGPSAELSRAYASNSFAASLIGVRRLALTYRRHAMATAESVGDLQAKAWALGAIGLSCLGQGQLTECDRPCKKA